MVDNLNIKSPEDPKKVNTNQAHELEYWSKKLKLTRTQNLNNSQYDFIFNIYTLPRLARLDAPIALHHIIARCIERKRIFTDGVDRDNFLNRLGKL